MLMERILSRENLLIALKRVERNGGSHGVDKISTQNLRSYIVEHWDELRKSLQQGTYEPQPVRRVEIPKPNGGVRLLGIPTVIDRFIQQAITQTLTPIYDPTFSENSYGFRPQRRGHDAVRKAKGYIEDGYRWVVDIDLEKFFDKVNHDKLMGLLSKRIDDKVLLNLVRKYLNAGIMTGGVVSQNKEGTPQGGPLSPLLSFGCSKQISPSSTVFLSMMIASNLLEHNEEGKLVVEFLLPIFSAVIPVLLLVVHLIRKRLGLYRSNISGDHK